MVNSMTIREFDKWLKKEKIRSTDIARLFNLSKYAISKWRERNAIPLKLIPKLEAVHGLDRHSLLRHLSHDTPELF